MEKKQKITKKIIQFVATMIFLCLYNLFILKDLGPLQLFLTDTIISFLVLMVLDSKTGQYFTCWIYSQLLTSMYHSNAPLITLGAFFICIFRIVKGLLFYF